MPELNPLTELRLAAVRTHNDAVQVWTEHRDELEGRLFVLSQPGPAAMTWPARLDLNGGGYLRSVFAHDMLWFTSHDILAGMFGERPRVDIALDYTVGFDSNVAQYLCNLVEGRMSPVVLRFRESLRHLAERRFNWEVMPVLMERSDAILAGRDLDHVWRVVHASEYFAACDLRHFATTGELRLERSAEEVRAATQLNLSEWHRVLTSGEIRRIRHSHALYHVLLLKARYAPHATAKVVGDNIAPDRATGI